MEIQGKYDMKPFNDGLDNAINALAALEKEQKKGIATTEYDQLKRMLHDIIDEHTPCDNEKSDWHAEE